MCSAKHFYQPGSVCAVAAAENSRELMWFIQITAHDVAATNIQDDYGHMIFKGENYLTGRYMVYHTETSKHHKYRVVNKNVYVREESVLYPFVGHQVDKNMCKVLNA